MVEGTVNAQSFTARRIDILEVGKFSGNAEVTDAVIGGSFDGKLVVSGRLTVKSTGRIKGEISYGSLEVEAGARIDGQIVAVVAAVSVETVGGAVVVDLNTNDNGSTSDAVTETGEEDATGTRPRVFRRSSGF